ncbi:hypothetical protein SMCF_7394 [Streptomyces coelicoflavus ZG0656]|nr:hypothetical protein SMCF_7394 [Streptomyces coelicoflavus ZG0656]MZE49253.1 Gfo/Idh/MocA family oxidoreductase [Streptomyces sp. SID5477]
MLTTVIVGAGVAGRELHHRALRRVRPKRRVVFVDPVPQRDVDWFPDFDALTAATELADAAVHVCSPVRTHIPVVETLIGLGARRFVLEKPIASSTEELALLGRWAREVRGLTVLPMAVWPHSVAAHPARAFARTVLADAGGDGLVLRMAQEKSRRLDSGRTRGGSTSAFDIELPHLALLARHLLGPVDEIGKSECWPAPWAPDDPASGGARVSLRHSSGAVAQLSTDLDATERRRWVRMASGSRWFEVRLPLSRDEPWTDTQRYGAARLRYDDRPIDAFLDDAYRRFDADTLDSAVTGHPAVTVTLEEHLDAAAIVLRAREAATRVKGA